MKKSIIISGFGGVASELIKIIYDKRQWISDKYNLQLTITGLIGSKVSVFQEDGIDLESLLQYGKGSDAIQSYCKNKNLSMLESNFFNTDNNFKGDILVEATPTNITTGEPALSMILSAISKGMNVASASKGALVTNFKSIFDAAKEKNIIIKYSGATAAALPTLDIGQYCLAGSDILSIEGILNGTTNYILSRMHDLNITFKEALQEAKQKGIAEKNSDYDIKGIDSACKILILCNSIFNTYFNLEDVKIEGIEKISLADIAKAKSSNRTIKLLARAEKKDGGVNIKVSTEEVPMNHTLSSVNGTNKCVVFNTDTMGQVAASGGGSDPKGAAAAVLKDIINMYRVL